MPPLETPTTPSHDEEFIIFPTVSSTPAPVPDTLPAPPPPAQNILSVTPSTPPSRWRAWPWKLIALGVGGLTLIGVGGFFGYSAWNTYDRYTRPIEATHLLPNDPNLVLFVTPDPQSPSLQALETQLRKFPGYAILNKNLDKTGKGQTLSESLSNQVSAYLPDFQETIRPALGEHAYVAINDLSPLGKELRSQATVALNHTLPSRDTLAQASGLPEQSMVLGTQTIAAQSTQTDDSLFSKFIFPRLDFVTVIEIKDLKKIRASLDSLQKNPAYTLTKKNFSGYDYLLIERKLQPGEDAPLYPSLASAIIGKNIVIASREEDLRHTILLGDAQRKHFFGLGKPSETILALSDNTDFAHVWGQLAKKNDSLLSTYTKLNMQTFFASDPCDQALKGDCVNRPEEYIKYPTDLIIGTSFAALADGIDVTTVSNRSNLSDENNRPLGDMSAKNIPEKVEGRWADIFGEHSDFNTLYYDFKKNNLTDAGLKLWKDSLDGIQQFTDIHPETDFIDQLAGPSNVTLFTSPAAEPGLLYTATIKDEERMRLSFEKVFTSIKTFTIQALTAENAQLEKMAKQPTSKTAPADFSLSCIEQGDCMPPASAPALKARIAKNTAAIQQLNALAIAQETTPQGIIFSWQFPDMPLAVNYTLRDHHLYLSSQATAIKATLQLGSGSNAETALSHNTLFLDAQSHAEAQGISQGFIVTQGLVNILSFALGSISPTEKLSENKDFTAGTAILRTIKYMQTSQTIQDRYTRSDTFFKIQELPTAEKEAADRTISGW